MAVLLEEHPLQHLGALEPILRQVWRSLAEVPEDRTRLGEWAPIVQDESRNPQSRVQRPQQLETARAIDDADLLARVLHAEVGQQQPDLVAVTGDLRVEQQQICGWRLRARVVSPSAARIAAGARSARRRAEELCGSADEFSHWAGSKQASPLPREHEVSTTASRIGSISLVAVPTPEQDRLIEFYESLGFEKRTDVPFGDKYRWVEVYPPSGTTGIALVPPREGGPTGGVDTGIILTTDDIDTTHGQLRSLGVDVDAEVARMGGPVPPMFWFRDPDGNTLLIVEQS
jgi:catechol 2,3-dioxygenase-like lactoylglutathione lyase family enzyme